ncbi:uncharacterized protein LOC105192153 [Harpegnathos saltator]|uniref:uncharacterized protein LOC105192153 n=1 Tax=Harpegnathos saltator TaxID=610380 RepID=UPI000DBEED96|nr:uncharacterized protein LOC105192153 [Harpegnathos saltator]
MHSIRNLYEEFDRRLYDNSEHRNLYVLDLNCDYAREVLRQAHSRKMFIAPAKWLLLQDRRTTIDGGHDDGSEATPTYDDSVLDIFENLAVYPDSDVVLALRLDGDFLELKSVYRPNPQRGAIWENRGNWTIENGLQMRTLDVASARRRNLHRTELKSCLVITDPDTMNHLTDFEKKTVDPVTKATYPWILHLVNRMNATVSFNITDSWGYRGENGSWNGMIGMLERREIDIGGTTTFFIPQRIGVVQYVQLYTGTRSAFVFRRPLLSTVKNIFVLPFQRNVWLAIAVFLLLVFCLLYLSMKWEHSRGASPESASYWSQFNSGKPAVGDNFLVLLGAFAQQGNDSQGELAKCENRGEKQKFADSRFIRVEIKKEKKKKKDSRSLANKVFSSVSTINLKPVSVHAGYAYEPYKVSTRIVTLMLLVASLSLYAAYTANIVGLLQSTTDSIRTLSDLLRSPLKLGAQDVVYSHHYFKAFRDPVRKAILEQRIEPKGRKPNWMTMDEGVRRVRNELFAFHGEIGAVYQLMQDTYLEEEKCGLTQIDYLNVLDPLLVVQMQSPYLEIIKNGALKLREYGLKYREEYRLYTEKPACTSETSFITIGLTECYFALVVMGYGMLLTAVVFALELLWHKKIPHRQSQCGSSRRSRMLDGCKSTRGMLLLLILCILAMSRGNDSSASSRRVDNVILKFIVNATPVLFPPSRISLHLCIDYDDAIKISREMSNNRLTHGIRNSLGKLDRRLHDNLEHRNLYALDLHCDYAVEILRQAHSERMFVAPTKWLLLQDRRSAIDDANLTSVRDALSAEEMLEDLAIYPDSDVVLAERLGDNFIQLTSVYKPSPQRDMIWENRGNWTLENGLQMRTSDVASARRRNLRRSELKSSIVITNPDSLNHLTDHVNKFIDPVTKANYIWILHLTERMNATVSFNITNTWGYQSENGSWKGIVGMLQRREIDFGPSMLVVVDRMDVVQYIHLFTRTSCCFVFRRPLLSTMKNIFILPFERNVWKAIAVFLLLVFCLLYLSMRWEYYRDTSKKSASYRSQLNYGEPTISDDLLVLLGAFAQQGYSYEPYRIASRIIILMLLFASLNLYAAYTANIVALLQSTTDSIKTPEDLLHSPLLLGVEDTVYYRHYFKTLQDPVRRAIMREKIEPNGRKDGWMSLKEGVRRVRSEPFAFHGGRGPIYQLIEETFHEEEKCGLSDMDYLNWIYPFFVTQKQSPYLEIIKVGALKLQEYGLKQRDEHRLYTDKPVCSSQTGFITIGFTECHFAIVTMAYGLLLSVIVFALELLWHEKQSRNTASPAVAAGEGQIRVECVDE